MGLFLRLLGSVLTIIGLTGIGVIVLGPPGLLDPVTPIEVTSTPAPPLAELSTPEPLVEAAAPTSIAVPTPAPVRTVAPTSPPVASARPTATPFTTSLNVTIAAAADTPIPAPAPAVGLGPATAATASSANAPVATEPPVVGVPPTAPATASTTDTPVPTEPPVVALPPDATVSSVPEAPQNPDTAERPQTADPSDSLRPITWLAIPRIHLQTKVVPAPLVEGADSLTWDIPSFVAGHAESTAGAGEVGNAVILGHVVSRTLGNVFEYLDRARPGDLLQVRSGSDEYDYTITGVDDVDRTDVEVLDTTPTATITLITCAGIWNPLIHDYMQRLVIRGELAS